MNKRIELDYVEIIYRLCGNITPYGESNHDGEVYDNLENYYDVMDYCLDRIRNVAEYKDRVEASMKSCGKSAYEYLKQCKEYIDDTLERLKED